MIITGWINWDISLASGFSGKSIMEEIYDNPKRLKIDTFYNTKILNKEELIWNNILTSFAGKLSKSETTIKILFKLRRYFLIVTSILIILALLFLSKIPIHINFYV
jgi:hypothetical protein